MKLVLILILSSSIVQGTHQQSVTKFSIPRINLEWSMSDHYVLDFYYEVKLLSDCAKECLYSKRCKSFHFDRVRKNCQLNKKHSSEAYYDDWVYGKEFVFSDKEDWPRAIAGTCADEPCGLREKCIPSSPPQCVGYCGVPYYLTNGWFWYGCTVAGCRLKHACSDGYTSTLPGAKPLCQEDGRWTSYDFQCVAHCGPPPSVGNATVGSGLETQDANRTYTCLEQYTSSSSSTVITCQSNSQWTTPDFQCN